MARCICFYRERPGDNGYARPIEGLQVVVDMARGEVLERGRHRRRPAARRPGQLLPGGPPAPPRPRAAGDHPARRARLHRRRPRAGLAGLVAPRLPRPAGGRRPARRRLPGPVGPPAGVDQRDGGALRRPGPGPRLEERLRRRRVGPRAASPTRSRSAATAWARSATSTRCSPTSTARPRPIANAICLHEEDDGILWKHHDLLDRPHRGPAPAAAGRVVGRHRRQLRVRASAGTSTRTPRSSWR